LKFKSEESCGCGTSSVGGPARIATDRFGVNAVAESDVATE
jgi:hypothetical protein